MKINILFFLFYARQKQDIGVSERKEIYSGLKFRSHYPVGFHYYPKAAMTGDAIQEYNYKVFPNEMGGLR